MSAQFSRRKHCFINARISNGGGGQYTTYSNISRCHCSSCSRSSHSIVRYAFVYTMRLTGHTHDRESPIQNFSTAPKKLGAHISSPVRPPKLTEFVSYLGNLRCDAFTALKSVQSARNESFLAGADNFHRVRSAMEFEA